MEIIGRDHRVTYLANIVIVKIRFMNKLILKAKNFYERRYPKTRWANDTIVNYV